MVLKTEIRISDDGSPGITRKKIREKWAYFSHEGERITDCDEIGRLNAIGLPPAYCDAWFCPDPNGHIQAVGWDEKGRKQYRYHVGYRAEREAEKFERCADFGRKLPNLRRRVAKDLRKRKLDRDRATGAVVRLIDLAHVRIGNEAYATENASFGATTLRKRHATIRGKTVTLRYKGKSGKDRLIKIRDRRLATFLNKCAALNEDHLFAWVDAQGDTHGVSSTDVNHYIQDITGDDFTAKTFRTWAASVAAFEAIASAERDLSLKALLKPVVTQLGNTPAVAQRSYVHPALIKLAKTGQSTFRKALRLPRAMRYLSAAERGLIAFLDRQA